jgi:hypothetical protein
MNFSSFAFISLGLFLGFNAKSIIDNSSHIDFIAAPKPYGSDTPIQHPINVNCSEKINSMSNNKINNRYSYNKSDDTISDLISLLSSTEIEKSDEGSDIHRIKIMNLLNQDKAARDEIISLYLDSNRGSDLEEDIFEIISNIDSEKLHVLSNKLIASGMQRNQILGLDLIRHSKDNNINVFDTVYKVISENQFDRSVLLSSIRVISKSSGSLEKKLNTLRVLEEHSNSGDMEIKQESLLSIGTLAKNMDQLRPVLALPQTEENKAIIAMAIRNNSLVNQELKDLLISYANDLENPTGVRGVAIESLARFDLTSEERSNMTLFVENFN